MCGPSASLTLELEDAALERVDAGRILLGDPDRLVVQAAEIGEVDRLARVDRAGIVDEHIEPAETRTRIINALRSLENKKDTNPRKKHGNIPL